MADDPTPGSDLIRTLKEHTHYPPHPPRRPTALYVANHKRLIYEEDRDCYICGVRNSTLGDPAQNRWGATQMETHHRWIEDSLANAIDLAKFNARLRVGLFRHTRDLTTYGHEFTRDEMLAWIHGHEGNLMIVCDVHHRHPLVGAHAITGPIWGVQDLLLDNFDLTGFKAHSAVEAAALVGLPNTTGQPETST